MAREKMALTPSERKQLQRERDRARKNSGGRYEKTYRCTDSEHENLEEQLKKLRGET